MGADRNEKKPDVIEELEIKLLETMIRKVGPDGFIFICEKHEGSWIKTEGQLEWRCLHCGEKYDK